jgi:hypothetical protein
MQDTPCPRPTHAHAHTRTHTRIRTRTRTGPGGIIEFSTGNCSLTRDASPLRERYSLECFEPGISYNYTAPRYTARCVCWGRWML